MPPIGIRPDGADAGGAPPLYGVSNPPPPGFGPGVPIPLPPLGLVCAQTGAANTTAAEIAMLLRRRFMLSALFPTSQMSWHLRRPCRRPMRAPRSIGRPNHYSFDCASGACSSIIKCGDLLAWHRRRRRRRIAEVAGLDARQLLAVKLRRGIAAQGRFAGHLLVKPAHRSGMVVGVVVMRRRHRRVWRRRSFRCRRRTPWHRHRRRGRRRSTAAIRRESRASRIGSWCPH